MLSARLKAARSVTAAVVTALAVTVCGVAVPSPAQADTAPPAGTPTTVTADALPTVQVDGVVWTQLVVGDVVYVGGSFTTARPAGAAPGTSTTPRSNLLAYDITTGALITAFAPSLNSQVRGLAASPDGRRLYAVGQFDVANGASRSRIAAFDTATGALITTFRPTLDTRANTVVATNDTVYVGGAFSSVNGVPRGKLAAVRAEDGALLDWAPSADNVVSAMVLADSGSKLIVGGSFTTMSGGAGYGLAALDPATGTTLPWAAGNLVRDGGDNAGITSLSTDGPNVYGTGYVFGAGGNLEGTFSARADTGTITWVEDCHGDTYSAFAAGGAVYTSSHAHYCGNLVDGYPETNPRTHRFALAFSTTATGTLKKNSEGNYYNYVGQPAPSLLRWFPTLAPGTFTGQQQAGWNITGDNRYVVMGGEFPTVNGLAQQGLVRFARTDIAPRASGPVVTAAKMVQSVTSVSPGTVRIAWPANWDMDNELLTYRVYRDGDLTTPLYETSARSTFWLRQAMGYRDTGLGLGSRHKYQVSATDPDGNTVLSDAAWVTVSGEIPAQTYADSVLRDGASSFWRLGEAPGSTSALDYAGFNDLVLGTGATRGAAGAFAADANTATSFDGTVNGTSWTRQAQPAPKVFAVEAWVRTTSTAGGKIVGFGNHQLPTSNSYDRHLYLDGSGRVSFGVYTGSTQTLTSAPGFNDGAWHHVVGQLGLTGMTLYVDGTRVGGNSVTTAQAVSGFWKVGGDNTNGWPGTKSSSYLNGTIDDVAVYPAALTTTQVRDHYTASGRALTSGLRPQDAYGSSVYDSAPDNQWRLDETAGTVAQDATPNASTGMYSGGVTQAVAGALPGAQGKAVRLDGINGLIVSAQRTSNPRTYSQELWFSTTTTRGGKLSGFGNAASGSSTSYDRHVYLLNDGRLRFGVHTGVENLITSTAAYNDGRWHQMVATQDPVNGMRLYVDGLPVGSNPQTGAQPYDGYWRVGGDRVWSGATSGYFAGLMDEVAFYARALPASEVRAHYTAGGGQIPNSAPVAAFTATASGLTASFDATGSTDPDGPIASYAWDFGDLATGTGATPSHAYAATGSYQVRLTVTDGSGATSVLTRAISVRKPNDAPVADFTATTSDLAASLDASASKDADGSVASLAWSLGDGTTATGALVQHTYPDAGTYQVTLTVTDNEGLASTATRAVTVLRPNVAPTAAFTAATADLKVTLDGTGSTDPDGTLRSYLWQLGDGSTATDVSPTYVYPAAGTYQVTLTVTDDRGATSAVTKTVTVTAPPPNVAPVAALTAVAGELRVDVDASGSSDSDGTVVSYGWDFGDGTAAGTGVRTSHAYAAAGSYDITLTVTDDRGATGRVSRTITVTAPPPPAPGAFATDLFGRSLLSGWGTADQGGAWTTSGRSVTFSTGDGVGRIAVGTPGTTGAAWLGSATSSTTDIVSSLSLDKALTGGGSYVSLIGRRVDATNDYRVKLRFYAEGAVSASLVRVVAGAGTTMAAASIAGAAYTPGTVLRVRLQATGTAPTTVRAKVWRAGSAEPTSWNLTTSDVTAALQVPGAVGVDYYVSASTTNAPVTLSVDDLVAGPPAG